MTISTPVDLSHLLSDEAASRRSERIQTAARGIAKYKHPIISLGGGLPLPELFPFNKLHVESLAAPFPSGINVVPSNEEELLQYTIDKYDNPEGFDIPLATTLQYGSSAGPAILLDFVKEHTKTFHSPRYEGWDVLGTLGNTQAWMATLRTFCNVGDTILTEEFTFSSSAENARGMGINMVPVKMDLEGILPDALEKQMANWSGPMPKLLYTIPTGQNPTGGTEGVERRKAIYKIAQKYDFIIIEDEPYYFLQMNNYSPDKSGRAAALAHTPSHDEFVESLVPSFLSLDTEGRVIRLDSFSKVIAPGVRLGWIVGQKDILAKYLLQHQTTMSAPSGFTSTAINGLLQRWGQKGYIDWLIELRKSYTAKRDAAMDFVEKYIPKEVATWSPPTAGMFFWIKVDSSKHPKYANNPEQLETDLYDIGLTHGALLVPGHWFLIKEKDYAPKDASIYFRGTFAAVTVEKMELGLQRFGDMLRKEFQL